MLDFLYNNLIAAIVIGIVAWIGLYISCRKLFLNQKSQFMNAICDISSFGMFEPMLKFTDNFGNVSFRGFLSLIIYLLFGVIDFFIDVNIINSILSLLILFGVINGITLIISFNQAVKNQTDEITYESTNKDARFLRDAYISLLVFRIVLYISYILIF